MKKGFNLVSGVFLLSILCAIVILVIINTKKKEVVEVIDNNKLIAMDSSFLMTISGVESYYKINSMFDNELDYNCMNILSLDADEYESCTYSIDNDIVFVTLKSTITGKFKGIVCSGTKNSFECK